MEFDNTDTPHRDRLSALDREADRMIDAVTERLHRRMSQTLDQLLRGEGRQFASLLEIVLRESVERVITGALSSAANPGSARRGAFATSALQGAADMLTQLDKARRNG